MATKPDVTVTGRLGRDPEPIATRTGLAMAKLSIMTDAGWRNVVCFGALAETVVMSHVKGQTVTVTGREKENRYTGRDGVERATIDIVARTVSAGAAQPSVRRAATPSSALPEDDDIPF